MNSGDPVTNTGWLQEIDWRPCDVDFMQGSGAFSMAALDTQRIIYAIIVGDDNDRFSSIVDLRRNTHFIRSTFFSEFAVKATATTEITYISDSHTDLIVNAPITSSLGIYSVQAELYDYGDSLIDAFELHDDGMHNDGAANDNVFGNLWQTSPMDKPLYLNLILTDGKFDEHIFRHAADKITLSNKIAISSFRIVDDNINDNLTINPGENVRLNFDLTNNYSFDVEKINVVIKTNDPFVQIDPKVFMFKDVKSGKSVILNYNPNFDSTYVAINITDAIPDTHTIHFDMTIFDNQLREWHKQFSLQVEPFEYLPNEIIATHISGKSDASFSILVIDPSALTGHSYIISIGDSINEHRDKGFNLIDQTLGDTLLSNHPTPDDYAYNSPIIDGFKVFKAFLPEGGLKDVYYDDVAGGHPTGFKGVSFGGDFFDGGVLSGGAAMKDYYKVELEFTNDIDSSGVVGNPGGQSASRYELAITNPPTGFFSCPFNVWKIVNGESAGRLNACFQEVFFYPTYDDVWAPDASANGGLETLYIMSTDYDESGQAYKDKRLVMNDVIYKVYLKLQSETSVVDAGDKMIFDWEYPATVEDLFTFIPTNADKGLNSEFPGSFILYQNYPNPFNPVTTIQFSVDKVSLVGLKIYNIMGQEVIELFNDQAGPGIYTVQWDGKNNVGQPVSSGLYFAHLFRNNQMRTIKLLLIR